MKKLYFFLSFGCICAGNLSAQVGIGNVSPNGALEITSANDGLLIPRIALVNTTTSTVVTPTVSEMVYNTATINDVTPGYYYWDGAKWIRLSTSVSGNWSLTGNTGTTAGTNYLGTNDAQNLQLRTGAAERLTIDGTNGNVVIGTPTISPTTKFEVSSGPTSDAISGHSNNVGGALGKEVNISFGTPLQTLLGSGVYANNPTAGYTSMFSQSTGTATVAASINFSDVWIASYNYVQNNTSGFNPPTNYNQLNVTNSALTGSQIALRGYSDRTTTTGNPGYTIGTQGVASAQNQDAMGVQGISFSNSGISAGGYFSGNNYSGATNYAYAYVGGTINAGLTLRKIIGTGSVSEVIPTEAHGRITLTCPESPEYWYQDYGTVQMINGRATIHVDDVLADIIMVDDENPLRVTCTPVGMPYFNGITIMSQTKTSVEILELNGGNHSGKLQYQLVAKPKTNYGEGRFPQAPGPGYLKPDKEPLSAKAKNQPNDGRKIYRWKPDHEVYNYNPEDMVAVGDVIPAGPHAGKIKLGEGKYGEGLPATNPASK